MFRNLKSTKIIIKETPELYKSFLAFKSGGTSSNIWLERQRKDPYVRRAVKETYRARSAFKLIEIDDKYKFLRPGDVIIDIGAAPGSWSQVAVKKSNSNKDDSGKPVGMVISLDRDFMEPIPGSHVFPHSDITDPKTYDKILNTLNGKKANSVISDMAPNCSGYSVMDHEAIIKLQMKAFEIAKSFLCEKGTFLFKIWEGDLKSDTIKDLSRYFGFVKCVKPPASRGDSAELFIFCNNFLKK